MRIRTAAATTAAAALLLIGAAGTASAAEPGSGGECTVPGPLQTVAAQVDPDSLEGCDYFEDPNYHDNRRAAGTYNPDGLFSTLFG